MIGSGWKMNFLQLPQVQKIMPSSGQMEKICRVSFGFPSSCFL